MAYSGLDESAMIKGFTTSAVTGTVLDSNLRKRISVETTGGVMPGPFKSMNMDPIRVHATEQVTQNFWLLDDEGVEHHVTLNGIEAPLRAGQRVTIAGIIPIGQQAGRWVVLVNHQTQQWMPVESYWDLARNLTRGTGYACFIALLLALLPFLSTDASFTIGTRMVVAVFVFAIALLIYAPFLTARHLLLRSRIKRWASAFASGKLRE